MQKDVYEHKLMSFYSDIFTGSFVCPPAAGIGSFCLAKSMVSSLIIHCNDQKGTEENCNDR